MCNDTTKSKVFYSKYTGNNAKGVFLVKIRTQDAEHDTKLVTLHGIVDENTIDLVQGTFSSIFNLDNYKVICDMEGVEHISAPVIKPFLENIIIAKLHSGDIKLLNVHPSIQAIFRYAGFTDEKVFCNDLRVAMQHFEHFSTPQQADANVDPFAETILPINKVARPLQQNLQDSLPQDLSQQASKQNDAYDKTLLSYVPQQENKPNFDSYDETLVNFVPPQQNQPDPCEKTLVNITPQSTMRMQDSPLNKNDGFDAHGETLKEEFDVRDYVSPQDLPKKHSRKDALVKQRSEKKRVQQSKTTPEDSPQVVKAKVEKQDTPIRKKPQISSADKVKEVNNKQQPQSITKDSEKTSSKPSLEKKPPKSVSSKKTPPTPESTPPKKNVQKPQAQQAILAKKVVQKPQSTKESATKKVAQSTKESATKKVVAKKPLREAIPTTKWEHREAKKLKKPEKSIKPVQKSTKPPQKKSSFVSTTEQWNQYTHSWHKLPTNFDISQPKQVVSFVKNAAAIRSNIVASINLGKEDKAHLSKFNECWVKWKNTLQKHGYHIYPEMGGYLKKPVGKIIYSHSLRAKVKKVILVVPGVKKDEKEYIAPVSTVILPTTVAFPQEHSFAKLPTCWRSILGEIELLCVHARIQPKASYAIESLEKTPMSLHNNRKSVIEEIRKRQKTLERLLKTKANNYKIATHYSLIEECFWSLYHDDGRARGHSFFDMIRKRLQEWHNLIKRKHSITIKNFARKSDAQSIQAYVAKNIVQKHPDLPPKKVLRQLCPAIIIEINGQKRILKGRIIST